MENFTQNGTTNETELENTPGFNIVVLPTWGVNFVIAVNVIIMVLAVTGNGVILLVEQFNRQKTSTDWMVTFMSVNDLLLAGCNIPINILSFSNSWRYVGNDALCGLMYYVQETLSYSSTLLLTLTALDRYIKTCHPHTTGITPRRARNICIGITIFTILFSSPIPFFIKYDVVSKCKYVVDDGDVRTMFTILLFAIQATFVTMFIIVIICYCRVAVTIRKRQRRMLKLQLPVRPQRFESNTERSDVISTRLTPLPSWRSCGNRVAPLDIQPEAEIDDVSDVTASKIAWNDPLPQHPTNDQNDTPTTYNAEDQPERNKQMASLHKIKLSKEAQMNKTTAIMFAVTIVFILSWVPTWISGAIWPRRMGETIGEHIVYVFCRRSFIINTCTNPLFYIGMSSGFRKLTKQAMRKIWYGIQKLVEA